MNTGDVITVIGNKEDSIPLCNIKHYAEFCVYGIDTAVLLTQLPQDPRLYLVYDPYSTKTYICFPNQIKEVLPSSKLTLGTVITLKEENFAIIDNTAVAYGEITVAATKAGVLFGEPFVIDTFSLSVNNIRNDRVDGIVAERYMASHKMQQPNRAPLIIPKNLGIVATRYREHFIISTPKSVSKIVGIKKQIVLLYEENTFTKEFDNYMNELTEIINKFLLTLPLE